MKLRNFLAFCIIFSLAMAEKSEAQLTIGDYELTSVGVSSGKGALTSGLDFTVLFQRKDCILEVTGNSDRVYFQHFWKLIPEASVAVSGGFFKNTPWLGYQVSLVPLKNLKLMSWSGFSSGAIEEIEWRPQMFFHFFGAYFTLGEQLVVGYAIQKIKGDPWLHLPGVTLLLPINSRAVGIVGADYHSVDKRPLYRLGVKYKI